MQINYFVHRLIMTVVSAPYHFYQFYLFAT